MLLIQRSTVIFVMHTVAVVVCVVLAAVLTQSAPLRLATVTKCTNLAAVSDFAQHPLVITGQPQVIPDNIMRAFMSFLDSFSVNVCDFPNNGTISPSCDVVFGEIPFGSLDAFDGIRKPQHAVVFRDPIENTVSSYLNSEPQHRGHHLVRQFSQNSVF